jgi:predicted SprT family Zn-dependent metalloprotease
MKIEEVYAKAKSKVEALKMTVVVYPKNKEVAAELEAEIIVLSALEKQMPKPPTYTVHEKYKTLGKNYYCQCGVMFVDFKRSGTNYCGNCGQRLRD